MEKPRSIGELLKIVRDSMASKEYEAEGICIHVSFIVIDSIITYGEGYIVYDYLDENRPQGINHLGYWWDVEQLEPRLKWLDEHIKLTSQ